MREADTECRERGRGLSWNECEENLSSKYPGKAMSPAAFPALYFTGKGSKCLAFESL